MARPADYETDILEWSEEQASALRELARVRSDLSNKIDWENIAEEIEDVGRSQSAAARSFVRLILIHLIKALSDSLSPSLMHWRTEVLVFRRNLLDRLTPSMKSRLDMAELWDQALEQAAADLSVYGQSISPALVRGCPVSLAEIIDPSFDFLKTIERVGYQINDGPPKG